MKFKESLTDIDNYRLEHFYSKKEIEERFDGFPEEIRDMLDLAILFSYHNIFQQYNIFKKNNYNICYFIDRIEIHGLDNEDHYSENKRSKINASREDAYFKKNKVIMRFPYKAINIDGKVYNILQFEMIDDIDSKKLDDIAIETLKNRESVIKHIKSIRFKDAININKIIFTCNDLIIDTK